MRFRWQVSKEIESLLSEIEVSRRVLRQSILKSALISAKIEGNQEMPEDVLLPRRKEILLTIRDHIEVSFNFIRRRFMGVPESNLHNDLRALVKLGLVKKLGSTRGAVYTVK